MKKAVLKSAERWIERKSRKFDVNRGDSVAIAFAKLAVLIGLCALMVALALITITVDHVGKPFKWIAGWTHWIRNRRRSEAAQREFEAFCADALQRKADLDTLVDEAVMSMTQEQRQNILDHWEI